MALVVSFCASVLIWVLVNLCLFVTATLLNGSLIFLDSNGKLLLNWVHPWLQAPWYLAADTTSTTK